MPDLTAVCTPVPRATGQRLGGSDGTFRQFPSSGEFLEELAWAELKSALDETPEETAAFKAAIDEGVAEPAG